MKINYERILFEWFITQYITKNSYDNNGAWNINDHATTINENCPFSGSRTKIYHYGNITVTHVIYHKDREKPTRTVEIEENSQKIIGISMPANCRHILRHGFDNIDYFNGFNAENIEDFLLYLQLAA